jgi:hypothetical protein
VKPVVVVEKLRAALVSIIGASRMNDKEHRRNLRRIAKAIEASSEKLRKAGIQFSGSEKQIHVPEQKPQFRQKTTDNSN